MPDNTARPGAESKEPGFFYGYVIVIASFLIAFAMYGTYFAYGVFLKPAVLAFGWSTTVVSGAFSLSMIVHGFVGIFMGHYSDKIGPRIVVAIGGFFLGLGYLLLSQIHDVWQLYLYYGVFVGIGVSSGWVCLLSTVARWFKTRRTTMCGIVLAGTGVGSMVIPPVASWSIINHSWQTSFSYLGIAVLLIIGVSAMFLKRDPSDKGQLPYGEDRSAKFTGLDGGAGLTLKEASQTSQFWLVCFIFLFFGGAMFMVNIHIIPYALTLGFSPAVAATLLTASGAVSIAGRLSMGGIADKLGNRQAFMIGLTLMFLCLFWLLISRDLWGLYLFAAIFGFAYGSLGVSESPLVAWLFGLKSHGLLLGVTDFWFTIGAAIGPVLAGYIFDVSNSYYLAFLIAGIGSVVALVLTKSLSPTGIKHPQ